MSSAELAYSFRKKRPGSYDMLRKLSIVAFGRRAGRSAAAGAGAEQEGQRRHGVWRWSRRGLDPTNAAAAAIAEVTLYNIYETLTKINEDGSVPRPAGGELDRLARPEDLYVQAAARASNSRMASRSIPRR